MKKLISITGIFLAIMLIITSGTTAIAGPGKDKKKTLQQSLIVLRGKVIDKETLSPLVFASVTVKETNVATVTNIDGEFIIKIPETEISKNLELSFIGYKNKIIPLIELKDDGFKNIITMEPAPIPLKEIIIKPIMPDEIINNLITSIPKNYPNIPNLMTAFYRETIRKNRSYISIGEAVVEIFKAPYQNDLRFDAIRIYKGRKNTEMAKSDTVLFKLQGGPTTSLELDIIKNPEAILTREALGFYNYTLTGVVEIDGRSNYIIEFSQKPEITMPLFMGKLFVDMQTFALSSAEFGFNLSNKEEATALFIKKKPLAMQVTPEVASYIVKYRQQNGKWYFAYSRAEVKFKVNWKRKLFNTNYVTMAEIAVTDRTDEEVIKFAGREKLRYSDIFIEEVAAFADENFWGDYNVIEPDQSIEQAIRRLARKVKFSDREK
ncbi:MAG: carboxypeptidase-like regulatory domain-containing protein [Bacteroidales bacterium]|nr:carboxypeptidase-like regulatory domain-containing protein [Bacteroidales bacterium]